MATPRVLILRAPGTNCDGETAFAFRQAGASTDILHVNRLREKPSILQQYQVLVIPGGFSYGDDVGAGTILANQLSHFLSDVLRQFRNADKLLLGICNGFQVLLKAGLILPADDEGPLATLTLNGSGRYEDRWIRLRVRPGKCPFLMGLESLFLPVGHAEGRFLCRQKWILQGLEQAGQLVLTYSDPEGSNADAVGTERYPANPNGSQGGVAGICDATGRVFGLMPHPDRHLFPTQHPHWTRLGLAEEGEGMALFHNAVRYFS